MKVLLLVLSICFKLSAEEIQSEQIKGIKIIGWNGQLTLIADNKSPHVKYRFHGAHSFGNFTTAAQLEDGWLALRVIGPDSKQDWRQEIPKINLEIRSKPVPVIASWVEGDVLIRAWTAPLQLTHKKGRVKIEDGKDNWNLSLHEGELDINKFSGSLAIDSYTSKIEISRLEGRAKIENFQGRLSLSNSKADVSLKSVQGKNNIENLAGTLEFENNEGEVVFSQSEGSVHGHSQAGIVDGKLRGAVEVRIRGEEPRLNLNLTKGIGARVDVGTAKGSLSSSLPLKSERLENLKLMRGQVSGSQVASVFVRLNSGEIRLR